MDTTIQAPLIASATEVPTRIALIDGEQEITYFELASAVAGNAPRLSERGVRPGDRVSIFLDKSSDCVKRTHRLRVAEELMRYAMDALRAEGGTHLRGLVYADNRAIQALYGRFCASFKNFRQGGRPMVEAMLALT